MNTETLVNTTPTASGDDAAIDFIYELVATPSVSGDEDAAVEVFVRTAAALGLEAEIDDAGNAVARRIVPGDADVSIALLGHIDTVPGDIPVRIEDGILHGRGSVDAKGPLAAMLFAAARADLAPGTTVHVIGALGEESPTSPGAHYVREQLRPDACIIGEPSGWDGVTIGYKGRLLATASVSRSCAHSAGPDESPADVLMDWWREVREQAATLSEPHERIFDQIQASVLDMDSTSDGMETTATLKVSFRLPETMTPVQMLTLLKGTGPGDITIECVGSECAHRTTRNDPVVRAISGGVRGEGGRARPKLKTGTADLNVVAPVWQCPIAAYGPGDSSLDHTPTEHLVLDEYTKSIRVLTTALATLSTELAGQ